MGLTAAARISAAVTRGILYGKGFAKPCIQFFADGTYRLRPTRSCCLVTRSWEPMLFNVREPIRIIYLLLFSLVGCRAPPPVVEEPGVKPAGGQLIAQAGHLPPFARMPYEAFSRTDAVAIAGQEWRLFGEH